MSAYKRAPFKPLGSWNPHGFGENNMVKPINPPAWDTSGKFSVQTEARIVQIWRDGGDYKIRLEEENGPTIQGDYYASDFERA